MLESFHPAVRAWFEGRFPAGPTEPQAEGWREIAAGRHTLIAAPTGSGKTLAAFLVCIDRFYRAQDLCCAHDLYCGHETGRRRGRSGGGAGEGATPAGSGPQVVYVSPLKALATDIQQNLEAPLREIAAVAGRLGLTAPAISVAVRTGDTAAAERAAMLKRPPDILITTPESLYLLLTAERSRAMLRSVRTVIVDEIHAVAGNKRGSHLTLTLERLAHVAEQPVQRVGLSATQRPIETVARLLVGAGPDRDNADGTPRCSIVDSGHRRRLDLALELPDDELGAVPTVEQTAQILDMITAHVTSHRTTLVFVNTRSMAERVAHQLGERLGDELGAQVAAHHGSLSRGRRQRVEARLRAGDLRALVATASLELGIDVGPVELVCQIGSPRSFATFLQRVGRSNHTRTGTPSGRLYPTTRDELVECAALLRGTRQGRLDAIVVPERPLDILAQQMVAESAAESWTEGELLGLARQAAPFRDLSAEDFEDITDLLAEGIRTGRGRRAYYLHRDRVNGTRQGPPGRPAGRADLRRGHSRARRLPGRGRAGRGPDRHRPRGVGGGEQAGRRLPARHPLLAHQPGGAGHGPGDRRARRAAFGAALAGRGARAHPGAVRGGLGAAAGRRGPGRRATPGPGCNKSAASANPRPRPSWPTCGPGWPPWARCPPWRPSSWSASSTRLAGCSWSGTRRSAPG